MASNQSKNVDHSQAAEKTKSSEASWPDFAIGLYDKLTGRGAQITYEFDNFNLFIPTRAGEIDDEHHFNWKMSGIMHIRTTDQVNQPEKNKSEKHKKDE
jgi:hypothetical protein